MEALIMGVSVFTNLWAVKMKLERKRYSDAILDGAIFIILMMVFAGTVSGLSIATMASSIFSFYLYFSPPTKLIGSVKEDLEPVLSGEAIKTTSKRKKIKIKMK
jgi:hypothetical protein